MKARELKELVVSMLNRKDKTDLPEPSAGEWECPSSDENTLYTEFTWNYEGVELTTVDDNSSASYHLNSEQARSLAAKLNEMADYLDSTK